MLQVVPTVSTLGQSLVSGNPTAGVMLVMFKSTEPALVSVTTCDGLVFPTSCELKVSFAAERIALGIPGVVPDRETCCLTIDLRSVVLSITSKVPENAPAAAGLNTTFTTQEVPGSSSVFGEHVEDALSTPKLALV